MPMLEVEPHPIHTSSKDDDDDTTVPSSSGDSQQPSVKTIAKGGRKK
jgi:hypothetical protein